MYARRCDEGRGSQEYHCQCKRGMDSGVDNDMFHDSPVLDMAIQETRFAKGSRDMHGVYVEAFLAALEKSTELGD